MSQIFGAFGWLFSVIINRPLGWILGLCYHIAPNYGLALILFTVITRFFLLPLAIKQQKSQAEMLRLQPKLTKIQKKYAKDKQKLQEEMMRLYQEEGYNPMGGCLPLLIQMPILFGLFNVIYKPLTYMVGLTSSQVKQVVQTLWPEIQKIGGSALHGVTLETAPSNSRIEIYAAHAMAGHMDQLTFLPSHIIHLDFKFLWLDLSGTPGFSLTPLLLIPILCYLTSLLSTWYSMKMSKLTMPATAGAGAVNPAGMNKSMILIMPLVSAYFATSVPAGVGFYWIITNLFMLLQTWGLFKFYNPIKLAEKAQLVADQRRADRIKSNPALAEKYADEDAEDTAAADNGSAPDQKAKPAAVHRAPAASYGKKKTKKQLMEENRRRLAASREREAKAKKQNS